MDIKKIPDEVKWQKFVTRSLVLHSSCILISTSFLLGWNFIVMNQPSEHIKDFIRESYKNRNGKAPSDFGILVLWSVTNAVFFPAGMIGSLASSHLSDRVGRLKAILISHIPTIIGSLMQTICVWSTSPEMLICGRFFIGIGCGLYSTIAPTYLTEIAPRILRGVFGALHSMAFLLGLLVASVIGLSSVLGTADLWQYILLLSTVPVCFSFIFLPLFPESPRYLLLTKGNETEARIALENIRQSKENTAEIMEIMKESKERESDEKVNMCTLIKTPHLRRPLVMACLLQFAQQITGVTAITVYSVGIFKMAGVPESGIEYAVVIQSFVVLILSIFGVIIMDKVGRRPLLLIPLAILIVDLIIFTVALILQDKINSLSYLSIVCSTGFHVVFSFGPGPIPRMIASELFRQGTRSVAMAVVGIAQWLSTFLMIFSFELIRSVTKEYTMLIFVFATICSSVYIYAKVPETKHKTIEDIARGFQDPSDAAAENEEKI